MEALSTLGFEEMGRDLLSKENFRKIFSMFSSISVLWQNVLFSLCSYLRFFFNCHS